MSTEKSDSEEFISRINELIGMAGNQAKLAEALGISQGTISGWKQGSVPQRRMLEMIREKYGVNPEWLAEGIEPKFKSRMAEAVSNYGTELNALDESLHFLVDSLKVRLENFLHKSTTERLLYMRDITEGMQQAHEKLLAADASRKEARLQLARAHHDPEHTPKPKNP